MRNFEKYIDEIVGSIYELSKLKEEGKFVIKSGRTKCVFDSSLNYSEEDYTECIIVDTDVYNKEKLKEFLLQEYKEPYKLTQFEYDLLARYEPTFMEYPHYPFKLIDTLVYMKDKGYFKDIPEEKLMKYIFDNCIVEGK